MNNATVTMTKAVDKNFADIGDTLTYTVSFTGTGNTNANNVIFTDVIPTGTTFVVNSLTIDGTTQVGANPANGVNIDPSQLVQQKCFISSSSKYNTRVKRRI